MESRIITLPKNVLVILDHMLQDIITTGQLIQADIASGDLTDETLMQKVNDSYGCESWLLDECLVLISDQSVEDDDKVQELLKEAQTLLDKMPETTHEDIARVLNK